MLREMMTPEQVAGYLQVTKDTVYRLIRQKRLAATRIGRAYRIPRGDLDAFVAANSTRPDVRQALFARVLGISKRNPALNGDALLQELEQNDESGRAARM